MARFPPAQLPKKLLLDDDDSVRKIADGGKRFLPPLKVHEHQLSDKEVQRALQRKFDVGRICDQLHDAKVICTLDGTPGQAFIPHNELSKVFTFETVLQLVHGIDCFRGVKDKVKLARRIYAGLPTGEKPCLRVVAVLCAIEKEHWIASAINNGICDECLPLQVYEQGGREILRCRIHKTHLIHENCRSRHYDDFATRSYMLNPPFINSTSQKHHHYILDAGDCFPFQVESNDVGQSIQGNQGTGLNGGGFSEVFRVKIDPNHFNFRNHSGIRNPKGLFAVKKLLDHDRNVFDLELSSLLFSMNQYTRDQKDPQRAKHLIQLLATFEKPHPQGGSCYYLLFDWAEGNLLHFWKNNPQFVKDKHHQLFMAHQFYELSLVLQSVHNERRQTLKRFPELSSNSKNLDLYGRHGDIKPANILWFKSGTGNQLALADFGLGRLHTQISRSNQNPGDLSKTTTYCAPEFHLRDGLVSRVSDVFSLGCVFLEYIIWYWWGLQQLNQFAEERSEIDTSGVWDTDFFFKISQDANKQTPELNDGVKKRIRDIKQDPECTWYLYQLLEIVQEMLHPQQSKRMKSDLVTKEMQTLLLTCQRVDSFYLVRRSSSSFSLDQKLSGRNSRRGRIHWVILGAILMTAVLFSITWRLYKQNGHGLGMEF